MLDFPWTDPADKLANVDVKRCPELMASIEKADRFPELGDFLRVMNSPRSMVETAKCDAWPTTGLSAEEDVYDASHKFASYVDMVFTEIDVRLSFSLHEQFASKLVELRRRAPDTPSAAEVCVRRCYFGEQDGVREGFYCTLNVSGYGNDEASARQSWGVGLNLIRNAVLQLSAGGVG